MRPHTSALQRLCILFFFVGCGTFEDARATSGALTLPDPAWPGFPTDAVVPASATGELPGGLSVGDDGSARYRLPLAVPRGRNGLEPELSLAYSSNDGDGVVGVGFSLAGVPGSVTRCSAREGRTGSALDFAVASFCWGGERLVPVGVSDLDGSIEYRTREESFARIRSFGSDSAPTRFEIELRNGRILRFNQRITGRRWHVPNATTTPVSLDSVTLEWAISREEDRYGNRIDYAWYTSDTADDGMSFVRKRLSRITYTSNGTTVGNRQVRFTYTTRTDAPSRWRSGVQRREPSTLSTIEMHAPTVPGAAPALQWSYRLTYDRNGITRAPRLAEVRRCNAANVCQPPTSFDWSDGSMETEHVAVAHAPSGRNEIVPGDLDGDGRTDLLVAGETDIYGDSPWWASFATDDGFSGASLPLPIDRRPMVVDVDADGQHEIVGLARDWPSYPPSPAGWGVLSVSREAATLRQYLGGSVFQPTSSNSAYAADFDGDGRSDLLTRSTGDIWQLRQGRGDLGPTAFAPASGSISFGWGPVAANYAEGSLRLFDSNGDGAGELVDTQRRESLTPHRLGVTRRPIEMEAYGDEAQFADVNGDGLLDLIHVAQISGPAFVQINIGNGFGPRRFLVSDDGTEWCTRPGSSPPHPLHDIRAWYRILDYDMDGDDDVLYLPERAVCLMDGARFRRVPLPFGIAPVDYSNPPPTGPLVIRAPATVIDWDADGLADFLISGEGLERRVGGLPDRLVSVWSGRGARTDIEYSALREVSLEEGARNCRYPLGCGGGGSRWVVSSVLRDTGLDDRVGGGPIRAREEYRYGTPYVDRYTGRFLGFSRVRRSDLERRQDVETVYDQPVAERVDLSADQYFYRYPGVGRWSRKLVRTVGDDTVDILVRSQRFVSALGTDRTTRSRTVRLENTSRLHWQIRGSAYATCASDGPIEQVLASCGTASTLVEREDTSYSGYTWFGEPTRIETTSNSAARRITTEVFYDDYTGGPGLPYAVNRTERKSRWLLGRPDFVRVTHATRASAGNSYETVTRLTRFGWNAHGSLTASVREPGLDPDSTMLGNPTGDVGLGHQLLGTYIEYEPKYGVMLAVTEADASWEKRTTMLTYDEDTTHVRSIRNPAGHLSWIGALPATGAAVLIVDPNGVATRAQYDGFGRIERIASDAGVVVDPSYAIQNEVRVDIAGGGFARAHLDRLGRVVSTEVEGLRTTINSSTSYDTRGWVEQIVQPAVSGTVGTTVVPTFDHLHRLSDVAVSHPALGTQAMLNRRYNYVGLGRLRVDTLTPRRHDRIESSPAGAIARASSFDDDGRELVTEFESNPLGISQVVTDPAGNLLTFELDVLGRAEWLWDADRGERSVKYNAWGEILDETTPEGSVSYVRDPLGRVTQRVDGNGEVALYEWDTAPGGIGSLAEASSSAGTVTFWYDSLGRMKQSEFTSQGETLTHEYRYDAYGRLSTVTYPQFAGRQRVVEYAYDAKSGVLWRVFTQDGDFDWRLESHDGHGRPLVSYAGPARVQRTYHPFHGDQDRMTIEVDGDTTYDLGLDLTADGLVERRYEHVAGTLETFEHDALERLRRWTLSAPIVERDVAFEYDDIGNLRRIDQVANKDGVAFEDVEIYTYPAPWEDAPNVPRRYARYIDGYEVRKDSISVDRAGRQCLFGDRTIEYDQRGLPLGITSAYSGVYYGYHAIGGRAFRADRRGKTFYAGRLVERRYESFVAPHQTLYIFGSAGLIGSIRDGEEVEENVFYTHGDSLGSPTVITAKDGRTVERQWFAPFGGRLDENGSDVASGADVLTSGFTGHRHEDDFGLIDMQGRFYDSRLRRFLTPDPIIGSMTNGQRWNPFSYVMNTPLNYVDPSGFDGEDAGGYDDDWYDEAEWSDDDVPTFSARAVVPPPEPLDTHWDDSWDQGMVEPTQAPFQPAPAEGFYANSGPELAGLAYAAFVEALAPFGLLERRRHFVTEDEATALRIGQTLGDVVGLVGDVAVIAGGVAVGVGGGGLGVVGSAPTAGAALAVSVASAAAGLAIVGSGLTDATIRIDRMAGEGNSGSAPRVAAGGGARSAAELLRPGGRLIGEAGTSSRIRILQGGRAEAEALFGQLSRGGQVVEGSSYPGTLVRLPGGGQVGFRPTSTSGPPTIDVTIEGVGIREIKFLP